jgi:hypothetical protein
MAMDQFYNRFHRVDLLEFKLLGQFDIKSINQVDPPSYRSYDKHEIILVNSHLLRDKPGSQDIFPKQSY